jgi:sphingomyelin phosphodiesterase acid-like 3
LRAYLAGLVGLLWSVTVMAAPAVTDVPFSFLALADIHFDPFAACANVSVKPCPVIQRLRAASATEWPAILAAADKTAPLYYHDTNYVLLQANLAKAKTAAAQFHPDFVLVLGDNLSHQFHQNYKKYASDKSKEGFQLFVNKTLAFLNVKLTAAFPDASIFMTVGNNDTYSHNYQTVINGGFLHQAGSLWSTLIKNPDDRATMRREFSGAGYYAVDVPRYPGLRLLVLNSVLFSNHSLGADSARAAMVQLDWLHQQLQQAKEHHQRVLIALHIPPALDVYVMQRYKVFTFQQFWQQGYLDRFKQELLAYYPEVAGILAGHLHYEWSQLLRVGSRESIPVLGVPSISPFFGNEPGFKIYHFGVLDNFIDDYYTYSYPLSGNSGWGVTNGRNKNNKAAINAAL